MRFSINSERKQRRLGGTLWNYIAIWKAKTDLDLHHLVRMNSGTLSLTVYGS